MEINITRHPEEYEKEKLERQKEQTCPICQDKRPKIGVSTINLKGLFVVKRTETISYTCGACGCKWDIKREERI